MVAFTFFKLNLIVVLSISKKLWSITTQSCRPISKTKRRLFCRHFHLWKLAMDFNYHLRLISGFTNKLMLIRKYSIYGNTLTILSACTFRLSLVLKCTKDLNISWLFFGLQISSGEGPRLPL